MSNKEYTSAGYVAQQCRETLEKLVEKTFGGSYPFQGYGSQDNNQAGFRYKIGDVVGVLHVKGDGKTNDYEMIELIGSVEGDKKLQDIEDDDILTIYACKDNVRPTRAKSRRISGKFLDYFAERMLQNYKDSRHKKVE